MMDEDLFKQLQEKNDLEMRRWGIIASFIAPLLFFVSINTNGASRTWSGVLCGMWLFVALGGLWAWYVSPTRFTRHRHKQIAQLEEQYRLQFKEDA